MIELLEEYYKLAFELEQTRLFNKEKSFAENETDRVISNFLLNHNVHKSHDNTSYGAGYHFSPKNGQNDYHYGVFYQFDTDKFNSATGNSTTIIEHDTQKGAMRRIAEHWERNVNRDREKND